jgi:hypothetical protein
VSGRKREYVTIFYQVHSPGFINEPLITVSRESVYGFNLRKSCQMKSGNTQRITQYHRANMMDDIIPHF